MTRGLLLICCSCSAILACSSEVEHQCYNFNQKMPGVSTMPSPYIGEFVQFDVTNVTRAQ